MKSKTKKVMRSVGALSVEVPGMADRQNNLPTIERRMISGTISVPPGSFAIVDGSLC